jgi:hypothetical protein
MGSEEVKGNPWCLDSDNLLTIFNLLLPSKEIFLMPNYHTWLVPSIVIRKNIPVILQNSWQI